MECTAFVLMQVLLWVPPIDLEDYQLLFILQGNETEGGKLGIGDIAMLNRTVVEDRSDKLPPLQKHNFPSASLSTTPLLSGTPSILTSVFGNETSKPGNQVCGCDAL